MTLALLVVQSVQAKVRQWCLSVLPSNTTSQREIGIAILVERPERDPKAVIDSIWAPNCTGFWIVCCCNWDCPKEGQGYQAHVHWQAVLHVQRLTVNGIINNICEQHVVQQATYMLVIMQVLWCSNIHIFTRLKADTTTDWSVSGRTMFSCWDQQLWLSELHYPAEGPDAAWWAITWQGTASCPRAMLSPDCVSPLSQHIYLTA